jgi:hypothetical protein
MDCCWLIPMFIGLTGLIYSLLTVLDFGNSSRAPLDGADQDEMS